MAGTTDFVEETKTKREELVCGTIYMQQGIFAMTIKQGEKKCLFTCNDLEQTKKCNACHLPE